MNMNKNYIGVFDSGLGGLTTVREIFRQMPDEKVVFLADTKNMPYGSRTKEEILSFTRNNISILKEYEPKAIVIACNTSDANAGDEARKNFSPLFGVIHPAVMTAVSETQNRKIAVMATTATVKAGEYERQIHVENTDIEVTSIPCPSLVPMIENGDFINDKEKMLKEVEEYLRPVREKHCDTLILGCTHYDLLDDLIRQIMPELKIVSSSRCVVSDLKQYLEENDLLNKEKGGQSSYLSTSDPTSINQTAVYLIDNVSFKKK